MKVNVIMFGSLREKLGFAQKEAELEDLNALKSWLEGQYPGMKDHTYLVALNQELIKENTPFSEGDEIAIMPPFAGG